MMKAILMAKGRGHLGRGPAARVVVVVHARETLFLEGYNFYKIVTPGICGQEPARDMGSQRTASGP